MIHDTDPSELSLSETTPLESPHSLRKVMAKLTAIEIGISDVASNQLAVLSRIDRFAAALEQLTRRVTSLEVSQRYAPLALSTLALVVSLWAAFQVRR